MTSGIEAVASRSSTDPPARRVCPLQVADHLADTETRLSDEEAAFVKQGLLRQPQVVAAVVVCSALVASALAAGWFIKEALDERRVVAAATNLRLAAQTVASADALHAAGVESSLPLVAAVETLGGDHELALHSLSPQERSEAEVLLDEIAGCGIVLLSPDGVDHDPHGHDGLQLLLARASAGAEDAAAAGEQRAALSLLVAAAAAGAAGWLLVRSRTSEMRLRRELQRQANTDLLTGLPNRRVLDPALEVARSQMSSTGGATALIFLDLDGFKDINDTLGHHEGDRLLVQVAARLRGAQRAGDVLLRLGGDEFAVVLSDVSNPDGAELAADRYLQILNDPFEVGSRPEVLRTSVGVTTTNDPAKVTGLTTEADLAMYEAKRSGGNAVAVFDRSMETRSDEASRITRALRAANYDEEFAMVYQPIVTVEGGDTTGFEALLRWNSPSLGPVGPNDFIPIAERSGEINRIGEWVLTDVCRQINAWDREHQHRDLSVSFNVSPHQLSQDNFVGSVLQTLDVWDVTPGRLVVEVTESAVLDHRGLAVQRLAELREAGLRISIDDFGSGYSNLGQLLHVPFDIIKIDRSLLLTLTAMRESAGGDSSDPCAIMQAIVSIASIFDAPVICEGVETEQQRISLRASGITHLQGYLTGRPTPPELLAPNPERTRPAAREPQPAS